MLCVLLKIIIVMYLLVFIDKNIELEIRKPQHSWLIDHKHRSKLVTPILIRRITPFILASIFFLSLCSFSLLNLTVYPDGALPLSQLQSRHASFQCVQPTLCHNLLIHLFALAAEHGLVSQLKKCNQCGLLCVGGMVCISVGVSKP